MKTLKWLSITLLVLGLGTLVVILFQDLMNWHLTAWRMPSYIACGAGVLILVVTKIANRNAERRASGALPTGKLLGI
ncbi:MAG: hypothetical protein WC794_00695 [Candidatus Doudnabacteria bacterium]|jgi:hypothetical protein